MIRAREYSDNFKETMVKKYFLTKDLSMKSFCEEYDIPPSTFGAWRDKFIMNNDGIIPEIKGAMNYTDKEKLQLLLESKTKSEVDLGLFLREKGITEDQLSLWEKELFDLVDAKDSKSSLKNAKSEIKYLKKDLRKKEKALAETTALLVLKKKANLLLGIEEDEE